MPADRPRPTIRLTDAERENAAARLHAAHDEGRISLDDLDERLAAVYGASVAGDLESVLDDIPTDRERRMLADQGSAVVELRGGLDRSGRWQVPRRLRIDHVATPGQVSSVVLDFRLAVVRHPQIDIDVRSVGSAQLILPPNGSADLGGLRGAGRLARTTVPAERSPGGIHLVVRGRVGRRRMVRVAYRPLPKWWAAMIG